MRSPRSVLVGSMAGILLALSMVFSSGCGKAGDTAQPKGPPPLRATLETSQGTIEIELLPSVAPKTVENFRLLAQRGYYNGLTFFRVVKGFMIQTGDPTNSGQGGESAWGGTFADEIDRTSPLYRNGYARGTVAMANYGPNTNKSQFFIVQKDYPLNPGFAIFGRVTKGMDVVDAIANAPTTRGFDGGMSKPVTPVVIKSITIQAPAPAPPTTGK
ncbi:MAG TPA: peptidylprolyl isomerase [Opitutaceae bacterium]|nr:peptidylprolyl isomerase [Opitutaceae bacterium]